MADNSNLNGNSDLDVSVGPDSPETMGNSNGQSPQKLNPRQLIMLKKEQLKKEKEEELTFKPKFISSTAKRTPSKSDNNGDKKDAESPVNRFEKLYYEARRRQEEDKKAKIQAEKDKPSFKPKITSRGKSKEKERGDTPEKRDVERYQASGAGRKKVDDPSKQKKEKTATPTKRSSSAERTSSASRLHTQAEEIRKKQQQLKEAMAKKELDQCTFAPKLISRPKTAPTAAGDKGKEPSGELAKRMEVYMELKAKKIEEAKAAKEKKELEGATFKPNLITSSARKSVGGSTTQKNVFERLSEVVEKDDNNILLEVNRENTFQPTLVTKRSPSATREGEDVHDRLYKEGENFKKKVEAELENIRRDNEKDNTFRPHVIHRAQSDAEQSKGPVFERLSASRQYVHEILTQIKTEFELSECTFKPEINPVSAELARSTQPVHVRLNAEAEKLKENQDKLKESRINEELNECTFTPQLGNAFGSKKDRTPADEGSVFTRLTHNISRQNSTPAKQDEFKSIKRANSIPVNEKTEF